MVAVHFGVYNFVRQHHTLGTTPAVAAGIEMEPWDLEQVVQMTADYMRRSQIMNRTQHPTILYDI
jgi:hypothetical protein